MRPPPAALLWPLAACALAACSDDAKGGTAPVATLADYAGAPGTLLLFTPLDDPEGAPIMLLIGEDSWEFRDGDFWRDAPPGDPLPATLDAALTVDGAVLLPGLAVGDSAGDATVTAKGELTVWYGTFPDAITVEIAAGPWQGAAAFALGIGPIRLARQGERELAWYERDTGDTGDTVP